MSHANENEYFYSIDSLNDVMTYRNIQLMHSYLKDMDSGFLVDQQQRLRLKEELSPQFVLDHFQDTLRKAQVEFSRVIDALIREHRIKDNSKLALIKRALEDLPKEMNISFSDETLGKLIATPPSILPNGAFLKLVNRLLPEKTFGNPNFKSYTDPIDKLYEYDEALELISTQIAEAIAEALLHDIDKKTKVQQIKTNISSDSAKPAQSIANFPIQAAAPQYQPPPTTTQATNAITTPPLNLEFNTFRLGQVFKALREAKGISIDQLGLNKKIIKRFEDGNGVNPNIRLLTGKDGINLDGDGIDLFNNAALIVAMKNRGFGQTAADAFDRFMSDFAAYILHLKTQEQPNTTIDANTTTVHPHITDSPRTQIG